ncbi:MAG: metalloregulator ArsR/SmtB family transcription factor [Proteobacteria bacterium]|nr:metalloregulator ArsR/SmtB family transcription factor [Pseudomonadota bacterium]
MESTARRMKLLAKFFQGLSDSSRLLIMSYLRAGPLSVSEIVKKTGLTQSNVSNHLACLRNCGHVKSLQKGRVVIYSLGSKKIGRLLYMSEDILKQNALGIYECTRM